ncbi:MAG: leucine-rich repeat protein [Ruminococcus callidus]|nr:leucine-rich repeat protein [Ruminococcus callidus]
MKIKKFIGALAGVTMLCASLPFSSTTVDFVKDNVLTAKAVPANVDYTIKDGNYLTVVGSGDMWDSSPSSTYEYASQVKSIAITDTITSIGAYAFKDFTNIKEIVIPPKVTKIGAHAFDGCTNLESITIPSSVIEIDEDAFKGTKWLANRRKESNNVVVVNGILADGKACSGNVVVPNSVKIISQYAFRGCQNLTNVTLPNSITQIETTPFYGCNKLQNIYYTGTQQEWESIKIDYRRQIMNATHKFDAKFGHSGDKDGIVIEAGKVTADISETRNVRVPISVFNNTGFATSGLKFTFDDGVTAVDAESGYLTPSASISYYGDTATVTTSSGTNKNGVIYYLDVALPYDAVVGSTYNIYMDNTGFTTSSGVDPKISLKNPEKPDADKKIKAVTITVTDKAKSVVTIQQASNPTPTPKPAENIVLGDVNKDNKVDSKDAVLVLKSYAESLVGGASSVDKARGDVNKDGSVDSKDAVKILKYYAASLVGNAGDITKY